MAGEVPLSSYNLSPCRWGSPCASAAPAVRAQLPGVRWCLSPLSPPVLESHEEASGETHRPASPAGRLTGGARCQPDLKAGVRALEGGAEAMPWGFAYEAFPLKKVCA